MRRLVLALTCACCTADDEGTSAASDPTAATDTQDGSESGSTTSPTEATTQPPASSTDGDSSEGDDGLTSGEVETTDDGGATTTAADESTGEGPTSGPGVLPGESGLEAFCRRYVECGGTYYPDQQACIDEAYGYWGECASRAEALDVFGACMADIACDDWSPDAYNPASTSCAEQWSDLGASDPC